MVDENYPQLSDIPDEHSLKPTGELDPKIFKGKYRKMAEQLLSDGVNEMTIIKYIRQEMENDIFMRDKWKHDSAAQAEWNKLPSDLKDKLLHNAYCTNCSGVTTFKSGYNIRKDGPNLTIVGNCSKCGGEIVRCMDSPC